MQNGTIYRSGLELFGVEVVRLAGQSPVFSPEPRYRFRSAWRSMIETIMQDLAAGRGAEIADFACHPEQALCMWLEGKLKSEMLENPAWETKNSISIDMPTGIKDFPKIRLVILRPEEFAQLNLPRNVSGATRDNTGHVIT